MVICECSGLAPNVLVIYGLMGMAVLSIWYYVTCTIDNILTFDGIICILKRMLTFIYSLPKQIFSQMTKFK